MKIYEEVNFEEAKYIAIATLENGIRLLILPDGSADGSDGQKYYNVSKEIDEDELITVGWTTDSSEPIVL